MSEWSVEKTIFVNGQWQGGGDPETLHGARDIAQAFFEKYVQLPISEAVPLQVQSEIIGCEVLQEQISAALQCLEQEPFDYLLTIGGGCDADVASIAYMNRKYKGQLKVIWLDAHGDLNAPGESESHLFYGMPLRALMGGCPPISELIALPLLPNQILHIGGRDFDAAELNCIQEQRIVALPVMDEVQLLDRMKHFCKDDPIYLHLDLDVLDPACFESTPLPVNNGMPYDCLIHLLRFIKGHCHFVGMGIFEYIPTEKGHQKIAELIEFGKCMEAASR